MKKLKVSAVVPAFNEEKTISQVLGVLLKSPLIDQIIVVDDGSTDETTSLVKKNFPQVDLISHRKNKGKADALISGVKKARNSVLFFCDADLSGLRQNHIEQLARPVIGGKIRMMVGASEDMGILKKNNFYQNILRWQKKKSSGIYLAMDQFARGLGGQKVLLKKDFLKVPNLKGSNYRLEHEIIFFFKKKNWSFDFCTLKGVTHFHKWEKWGFRGVAKEAVVTKDHVSQFLTYLRKNS